MICPKCGYDCGNAKFCPECGEKLLGKTVNDSNAQVWSVGMPCPHCGGTKLDGNCCAFCGAQLMFDAHTNQKEERITQAAYCPNCLSTSIAVRERTWRHRMSRDCKSFFELFITIVGTISLDWIVHKNGDECVCMNCGHTWYPKKQRLAHDHKKFMERMLDGDAYRSYRTVDGGNIRLETTILKILHPGKAEQSISYGQIFAIKYQLCEGVYPGWLSIRDKSSQDVPFPDTIENAQTDPLTIMFSPDDADMYKQISEVLNVIAEENNRTTFVGCC